MNTEFRAECMVNLWLEAQGHPAKRAWACSIDVAGKKIVTARRFLGMVSVDEAELGAALYALRSITRLLQEKVEVRSNFPLEGMLSQKNSPGRGRGPDLQSGRDELRRLWDGIRLKRAVGSGDSALADEARKSFRRREEK